MNQSGTRVVAGKGSLRKLDLSGFGGVHAQVSL